MHHKHISWRLGAALLVAMACTVSLAQGESKAVDGAPRGSIFNLQAVRLPHGGWAATFDVEYRAQPGVASIVSLRQLDSRGGANEAPTEAHAPVRPAELGQTRMTITLPRPADGKQTIEIRVQLATVVGVTMLGTQTIKTRLDWPTSREMYVLTQIGGKTPEQIVALSVERIDTNERTAIEEAKVFLERAIEANPRLDIAYIEMARVSMKLNWGPEGLLQAERFLDTAMQIQDSVNARILLAYVYAHQRRYQRAEALLDDVAKKNPPNLWLWANWGELEELQGHADKAIAKYQEAIARPHAHDPYDRARVWSYIKLFPLLEARADFEAVERLHKQRTAEYGLRECHGVAYARFLVGHRGDASAAIVLARREMEGNCQKEMVRDALGLAYYMAWSNDPKQLDALNQARIYLPVGAKLFYQLAQGDRTAAIGRKLVAAGEKVDVPDNGKWNALAYALQARELSVARRLIALGAKPAGLVGEDQYPVAFLPVFMKDQDGIGLMKSSGVDYAKLRHKGVTAIDMARQAGERELVQLLERPGT